MDAAPPAVRGPACPPWRSCPECHDVSLSPPGGAVSLTQRRRRPGRRLAADTACPLCPAALSYGLSSYGLSSVIFIFHFKCFIALYLGLLSSTFACSGFQLFASSFRAFLLFSELQTCYTLGSIFKKMFHIHTSGSLPSSFGAFPAAHVSCADGLEFRRFPSVSSPKLKPLKRN